MSFQFFLTMPEGPEIAENPFRRRCWYGFICSDAFIRIARGMWDFERNPAEIIEKGGMKCQNTRT